MKKQQHLKPNKKSAMKQKQHLKSSFLDTILSTSTTALQTAISRTVVFTHFYALRLCQFSKAQGERHTKIITLGDIHFLRKDNSIIAQDSHEIYQAYSVMVDFTKQKNQENYERMITMNTGNPVMNPVYQLATIVHTLRSHPKVTDKTPICTYINESTNLCIFTQTNVLQHLRNTVASFDEDILAFTPHEIRTQSIRTQSTYDKNSANENTDKCKYTAYELPYFSHVHSISIKTEASKDDDKSKNARCTSNFFS